MCHSESVGKKKRGKTKCEKATPREKKHRISEVKENESQAGEHLAFYFVKM